MAIIKYMFVLWLLIMVLGAGFSLVVFVIDVIRWHVAEKKVIIEPSRSDTNSAADVVEVREGGNVNAGNESEHNSSAFPFTRS